MPLYTIRRDVPGADQAEIDAASLRAISCAYEFPGLRWIRTYWDEDGQQLLCLYEGTSAEQIRDHARRSRIPCDEVREVVELDPAIYTEGETAPGEQPAALH